MKRAITIGFLLCLFYASPIFSQCMADAGTSTLINDGGGTVPFVVCFGSTIEIESNGDYVLPPAAGVAGLMWLYYDCPPTDPDPNLDPCWLGGFRTSEDFINLHDGSTLNFLLSLGGGNTFWIAPIASDAVDGPAFDADGDGCFDVNLNEVYNITFLNELQFNVTNMDNCTGEV